MPNVPGSRRVITVERFLHACVLGCALLCLLIAPARAAGPRAGEPARGPDVLVIVLSGLGPTDQVSINYNSLVSKGDAEADINSLARGASWTISGPRVTTGGPSDRQTTSSSFQTPPLPNPADGTLPIEPFILALQRFGRIQINYIVNSQFDFRGLEDFEDDRIKLNLVRHGNSFEYTALVKESGFSQLSLPVSAPKPGEADQSPSGAGRIVLIIGIALALAVAAYLIAAAVSRRRCQS